MHAMKSGTPGSGRAGFPSETFREDPLRLGVNLARRMAMRETDAFALLKKHLFGVAPGEIAETGRVTALLAGCWHEFVGGESQRMHAGKLGRIENVRWEPPVLSFRIEGHGAMRCGIDSRRAPTLARRPRSKDCSMRTQRQLSPGAAPSGRSQDRAARKGTCR
jgi:hypothetical protein